MDFFRDHAFDDIFGVAMSESGAGSVGVADEAAKLRRAQRNREAAHRSRAKHKRYQQHLEAQAANALELHAQLRSLLDRLIDEIAATTTTTTTTTSTTLSAG